MKFEKKEIHLPDSLRIRNFSLSCLISWQFVASVRLVVQIQLVYKGLASYSCWQVNWQMAFYSEVPSRYRSNRLRRPNGKYLDPGHASKFRCRLCQQSRKDFEWLVIVRRDKHLPSAMGDWASDLMLPTLTGKLSSDRRLFNCWRNSSFFCCCLLFLSSLTGSVSSSASISLADEFFGWDIAFGTLIEVRFDEDVLDVPSAGMLSSIPGPVVVGGGWWEFSFPPAFCWLAVGTGGALAISFCLPASIAL